MKIYGKSIRLSQLFFLTIYYGFAQYLPRDSREIGLKL